MNHRRLTVTAQRKKASQAAEEKEEKFLSLSWLQEIIEKKKVLTSFYVSFFTRVMILVNVWIKVGQRQPTQRSSRWKNKRSKQGEKEREIHTAKSMCWAARCLMAHIIYTCWARAALFVRFSMLLVFFFDDDSYNFARDPRERDEFRSASTLLVLACQVKLSTRHFLFRFFFCSIMLLLALLRRDSQHSMTRMTFRVELMKHNLSL